MMGSLTENQEPGSYLARRMAKKKLFFYYLVINLRTHQLAFGRAEILE